MKSLSSKVALITGATRGIGAAVARRYAREGAELILVGRSTEGLEAIDDEVRALGAETVLVPLDLLEFPKIDELAQAIHEKYGRLDILVGNAGMLGTLTPLHQMKPKEWHQVIGLNLHSNWHLIRAFDPLLRLSNAGRAIFVTTGDIKKGIAYWGAYATSKAGLETMVRAYSEEVGNTNIKVNLINPGATNTDMLAGAYPGKDLSVYNDPDDITEAFVKLALDNCSYQGEILEAKDHIAA